jgi:hypothetical protein
MTDLALTSKNYRKGFDYGDGNFNADEVEANAKDKHVITITNPYSHPVRVLEIQTRFEAGLEKCTLKLQDNNKNEILSGNLAISQLGNRFDANVGREGFPVNFILSAKTELKVLLSGNGTVIPVGTVNVAIFGVKEN